MRKILLYSVLLVLGLAGSQWLPHAMGSAFPAAALAVRILTMLGLSFIMIRVGYEFDIDKSSLKQYGWDYFVAFTAASFPWIFVSLYFVFVLLPPDAWGRLDSWKETLLAGRFAAPTSAGVLFTMLAAGGLGATWLFRKARVLAIFDDLDTVLLMIPLKMLMVGLAWQLGVVVLIMFAMLAWGYAFLHKVRIPVTWPWVLAYAGGITGFSELVYWGSRQIDASVPVHVEVLLPAFMLGCVMAYPRGRTDGPHDHDMEGHHPEIETPDERRVTALVAGAFMLLVGLSMPAVLGFGEGNGHEPAAEFVQSLGHVTSSQPPLGWGALAFHTLVVTVISNLGKMFPALCYRKEARWRERLALAIGMWPRGEVGAGVLVISLSYGIGGPIVTVAMFSLALNLVLTGVYIYGVKRLTRSVPGYGPAASC